MSSQRPSGKGRAYWQAKLNDWQKDSPSPAPSKEAVEPSSVSKYSPRRIIPSAHSTPIHTPVRTAPIRTTTHDWQKDSSPAPTPAPIPSKEASEPPSVSKYTPRSPRRINSSAHATALKVTPRGTAASRSLTAPSHTPRTRIQADPPLDASLADTNTAFTSSSIAQEILKVDKQRALQGLNRATTNLVSQVSLATQCDALRMATAHCTTVGLGKEYDVTEALARLAGLEGVQRDISAALKSGDIEELKEVYIKLSPRLEEAQQCHEVLSVLGQLTAAQEACDFVLLDKVLSQARSY